jgi:hypothetical protein
MQYVITSKPVVDKGNMLQPLNTCTMGRCNVPQSLQRYIVDKCNTLQPRQRYIVEKCNMLQPLSLAINQIDGNNIIVRQLSCI